MGDIIAPVVITADEQALRMSLGRKETLAEPNSALFERLRYRFLFSILEV